MSFAERNIRSQVKLASGFVKQLDAHNLTLNFCNGFKDFLGQLILQFEDETDECIIELIDVVASV